MRVAGYKWLWADAPLYGRVRLVSGFNGQEWTRGTNHASFPPSPGTLWGFNAYFNAARTRWFGRGLGTVMVGLTGFGTVALFERGWRAEKAEIVCVYVPRSSLRRAERQLEERLRLAYDVPIVHSLRALRRETERWGIPGKALLRAGDDGASA